MAGNSVKSGHVFVMQPGDVFPSVAYPGDIVVNPSASEGQRVHFCLIEGTWTPTISYVPENSALRGQPGGYAALDSGGLVPTANLPASGPGGAVSSVFGRTGAVIAAANDYSWTDIASKPLTFAPSAHTHSESEVTGLVTDLSGKAASVHTHSESDITGLVTDLGNKSNVGHTHVKANITDFAHTHPNTDISGLGTASTLNVPATGDAAVGEVVKGTDTRLTNSRTPSAHTHVESDVTGLVTDLAGKSAVGHTHVKANITDFAHTHPESEITNLVTDLAGKQASLGFTPANSTITISTTAPLTGGGDLSGNRTFAMPAATTLVDGYLTAANWNTFNGKQAALGFTPANSIITISTTAPITGGGDLSTNRTFAIPAATTLVNGYLTSTDWNTFNNKQAALGFTPENSANKNAANGYAPLNASGRVPISNLASGTPTGALFIRDDGTLAAPSGGSDPWTYVKLASDFTTSSASAVDVTGLAFTPTASLNYEFEGLLLLRTATATVNPRAGLAWPTGMTDGVATIAESQAATGTPLFASGNPNAALLVAVGGLPNTTQSWPVRIVGMVISGASPSGTVKIQLASETAGTNVTIKAGSYIKYRTF